MIYFAQARGEIGPIKISCASSVPASHVLDARSPFPLEVLATTDGGPNEHRWLEVVLDSYRSHYQWFYPAAPVFELILDARRASLKWPAEFSKRLHATDSYRYGASSQPKELLDLVNEVRCWIALGGRLAAFKSGVRIG